VCPCFNGHEVRNGRFVVFGLPERLAQLGSFVSMWSPDVTVITKHPLDSVSPIDCDWLGIQILPTK